MDWNFPEKLTYASPGNYTNQDFIGVKLGDVDASAIPANNPTGAPTNLVWKVQDQILVQDDILSVEFRAENFEALMALQFGLQFDASKLEFVEQESIAGSPLQASNFGLYDIATGEIRSLMAVIQSQSLTNGAPAFRLRFKVLQSGGKLSDVLQLSDDILQGYTFASDYTPGSVDLEFESLSTGTDNPVLNGFELLQNQPNPFKRETVIGFKLPEACEGQLRVFDISGRLVEEQKGWFAKGYNERAFRFDGYTGDGMLYYELVTPFGTLSKKMVLVRN
jgi:hypothetical protein